MASKATLKKMKSMFNGDLPIVNALVITGFENGNFIRSVVPVEVLTVNFNTQTMRVRYIAAVMSPEEEILTCDIDYAPFMESYKVVKQ